MGPERTKQRARSHCGRRVVQVGVALFLGLLLSLTVLAQPASAHTILVQASPGPREVLKGPPAHVNLLFSEHVNSATSQLRVVDEQNRQVDNHDAQVDAGDARKMSVSLPLLKSGSYTVIWRTQSADDGHVSSGSYYFQIARPDGSVPPAPTTTSGGQTPDAGSAALDGPSILQAICTWIALALLTLWVGGVIRQTWLLAPSTARDPDLARAAKASAQRFLRLGPMLLGALVLADIGIVLAQSAALAGDWSGLFSTSFLRAILFGSRFGAFWWGRQIVALVALYLLAIGESRGWRADRRPATKAPPRERPLVAVANGAAPIWRRAALSTVRAIRTLPSQFAQGWRASSRFGRAQALLAALLLVAFAFSGHAAAVPANQFVYAISIDLLHLVANSAWLGGIFYISVIWLPALARLTPSQRARALAQDLPAFSALAILSVVILSVTGSLNATVRMTSFAQLLTTTYGRTLVVKIELFILMMVISAYHAFVLRPRLAYALAQEASAPPLAEAATSAHTPLAVTAVAQAPRAESRETHSSATDAPPPGAPPGEEAPALSAPVADLTQRLQSWLRREAILGAGVLLCVALLGAYAGTLATAPLVPVSAPAANNGPYVSQPQQAGDYNVVLKVTPATFGTNTFVATLTDAQGKPVAGASVLAQTTNLDMDMGASNIQLKAVDGSPGTYSGDGELAMAGNWAITIKVLPPNSNDFVNTVFKIVASN